MSTLTRAKAVGTKIRNARQTANMSQDDLAFAARRASNGQVSPAATDISRYERGLHLPRADMIGAIAKATGHDIEFFLAESDEAEPDEEAALSELARRALTLGHYDMVEDLTKLAALAAARKVTS